MACFTVTVKHTGDIIILTSLVPLNRDVWGHVTSWSPVDHTTSLEYIFVFVFFTFDYIADSQDTPKYHRIAGEFKNLIVLWKQLMLKTPTCRAWESTLESSVLHWEVSHHRTQTLLCLAGLGILFLYLHPQFSPSISASVFINHSSILHSSL